MTSQSERVSKLLSIFLPSQKEKFPNFFTPKLFFCPILACAATCTPVPEGHTLERVTRRGRERDRGPIFEVFVHSGSRFLIFVRSKIHFKLSVHFISHVFSLFCSRVLKEGHMSAMGL